MAERRRKKRGEARPESPRYPRAKAAEPEPEKQPRVVEAPGNPARLARLLPCVLAPLWEKARALQLLRTPGGTALGLGSGITDHLLYFAHNDIKQDIQQVTLFRSV